MNRLHIDWQTCCLNLRNKYKPLKQVAQEIGCDEQTLNRLARNEVTEPRFTIGTYLLYLHVECMGEETHRKLLLKGPQ